MSEEKLIPLVYLVRRGQGFQQVNIPMTGGTLNVMPGQRFDVAPRVAKTLLKKHPGVIAQIVVEEEPASAADQAKGE